MKTTLLSVAVALLSLRNEMAFSQEKEKSQILEQTLRFFIDPELVTDLPFAKICLKKYVDDMNFVLGKNTVRWLKFDPETDVVVTSELPRSPYYLKRPYPSSGFAFWAHIKPAKLDGYGSYGGNVGADDGSGAAVLENLFWESIHDPDTLGSDANDYFVQVGHMLHEMAHVFGAGMGEYYNFSTINDKTGALPSMTSRIYNFPNDPYWKGDKVDYFPDPLLGGSSLNNFFYYLGSIGSRDDMLRVLKYSPLTAAILNGSYREDVESTVPDLKRISIQVIDQRTGLPIPNALVKIWLIDQSKQGESTLEWSGNTDASGAATFAWGANPFSNVNGLKCVKAYHQSFSPAGRYISVFDLQEEKMLRQKAEAQFVIPMAFTHELPGEQILLLFRKRLKTPH